MALTPSTARRRQISVIGAVAQPVSHRIKISNVGWFCKENVKALKYQAFQDGKYERF